MAVGPDGSVYMADWQTDRVRVAGSAFPGLSAGDTLLPSQDGSQVFVFDAQGRHLKTLDALTGSAIYQFGYDSAGRLSTITDAYNNATTIRGDASGHPTAIIAPGGEATALTTNSTGYLASISDPDGNATRLSTASNGLLQTYADPDGKVYRFSYDGLGRLILEQDPAGGRPTLSRTTTYGVRWIAAAGVELTETAPRRREDHL